MSKIVLFVGTGLIAGLAIGTFGVKLISGSDQTGLVTGTNLSLSAALESSESGHGTSLTTGVSDWCVEHRVPESACTLCNPSLIPSFQAKGDWCVEHQFPESIDRKCHPELTFAQEPVVDRSALTIAPPSVFFPANSDHCATDDAVVQFASAETAVRSGLTFAPAIAVDQSASAEAPAELLFDDTRSCALTTRIPTTVSRWLVEPGTHVRGGEPLAELDSPEMPKLQADYLDALAELDMREKESTRADSLSSRGMISKAEAEQIGRLRKSAQAKLSGAIGMLTACGLNESDLKVLQSQESSSAKWLLRAPNSGVLLERRAHLGELLSPGATIALTGDPTNLWAEAQVRETDLDQFKKGEPVEFSIDGDALNRASGKIIWVAQFVDPLTRSATVRAEMPNANLALKAHQFGRIEVTSSQNQSTVAVPRDAVQWEGCCNVVFVQEAPDRYRPHKVMVSRGDLGYYNIDSGINPGDVVVVKGSYLLKTELKKGSLGAGCCAVAPKS
jgi:membrane fusion protein, heavy metal efflux system